MVLLAGLIAVMVLSACGAKTQEEVVSDLNEKLEKVTAYKADAKMTLQMGTEPQTYEVEIWHKDPKFYRVNLKNAHKDQSQMILRNDEGVFVLTPALNKSFKFTSDWPTNSSQAYLYESLVKDILEDKEAKFKATKTHYIFETKTRYQNNKMLPLQEIKINKKDLSPVSVKVMDSDRNALVTVEFSNVKFDASFDKNDFDMKKNMTGAQLEVPVMGKVTEKDFAVKYPTAEIVGVNLISEKKIKLEDGERAVLKFGGEKSYTLIEEKAEVVEASATQSVSGKPVDLGFAIGALSENRIFWTHQGVDYSLTSTDLTEDEMVMVARSVQGEAIK